MGFCTNCGAGLGPGRFCTNCGAPVQQAPVQQATGPQGSGAGESAVEKTAVRLPRVPRAPEDRDSEQYTPPPPPPEQTQQRPLFADEVPTRAPGLAHEPAQGSPEMTAPRAAASPAAETFESAGTHRSSERRRSPLLWLLPLLLVAALVIGLVVWLGPWSDDNDDPTNAGGSDDTSETTTEPTRSSEPSEDSQPTPSDDVPPPEDAVDITEQAKATGPAPIKPGVDLSGDKVRYPASNMLDGDPTTAYRLPGDASGTTITLSLPEETTIHQVGLINGYAKTDTVGNRTVDWYAKNRRITKVEWSFDDGTSVTQTLRNTSDLQVMPVEAARTREVRLRIVSVSAPGKGDLSKNVTAISSVQLRGATG